VEAGCTHLDHVLVTELPATAHAQATGHPIIRSVQPGEDWSWCYPDQLEIVIPALHGQPVIARRRSAERPLNHPSPALGPPVH
jgi:hypothetical protein